MMIKGILSLSPIQSLLSRPFQAKTGRILALVLKVLGRLHWLVQYQEKGISYWIPSYVGIRGNEKVIAAAKAGLEKELQIFPFLMAIFKKHINVLMKHKWQSDWDDAINNYSFIALLLFLQ